MDASAIAGITIATASLLLVLAAYAFPSAPHFPLRNRVVVITGGSSGIGKAVALEAARRGAHIVLLARTPQPLREAQAVLKAVAESSQRILVYPVDVTDDAAVRDALRQAAADCGGRLDALVCSAGTSCPREFAAMPAAEFESVVRLNLFGTRNAVAGVLPHMRGAGGGRVVLISSQAGQVGLYGYTAYSVRWACVCVCVCARAQRLWCMRMVGCAPSPNPTPPLPAPLSSAARPRPLRRPPSLRSTGLRRPSPWSLRRAAS